MVVGEEDVLGLDVAVDDPLRVGIGERRGHLAEQPDRVGDRQLARSRQARTERFAFDQGHGVVRQAVGLASGEQRDDVRMLKSSGEGNFPLEPLDRQAEPQLRQQDLHDHRAAEGGLPGDEDPRHPAPAQFALEGVGAA